MPQYFDPRLVYKTNTISVTHAPYQIQLPNGKLINGNRGDMKLMARQHGVTLVTCRKTGVKYNVNPINGKFVEA